MARVTSVQLNEEQRTAVEHGEGPLLIVAGAGTGKTTVVTERIKYLILGEKAKASEILALTFTEKAAREMEERVDQALPYGYTQMWIATFHSFCDRVLRNDALHIGLTTKYKLLTEAETIQFLRSQLFKFPLKYFRPLGNPNKFLGGMLQHFSRLKDEDVSPTDYLTWAKDQKGDGKENEKWLELSQAYLMYEEMKTKEGIMDFSDLIANTLKLFRERPNVLKEYKSKFKYILVDEFQDTNIAQNELVKLLAGEDVNLTVVADDDQSIYKWRGASVSNVIQFRKNFPQTKVVTLTQNYRSTQAVLDYSHKLIQNNNPDRLEVKENIDKKLVSVRKVKGLIPEFIHADRAENEAELVVEKIAELVEEGYNFSDFAILVRANSYAEPFIRAFARNGVPCQFLGPGQLFRQPEVMVIIAYLKVLYNFEDSAAFYKVLTMEQFNIPARDLAAITNYARRKNCSLFEAAEKINEILVNQETKEITSKVVEMIHKHLKLLPRETAGQIAYYLLEESGILKMILNSQKTITEEKRAQNIAKFFDKLKSYEAEHEDSSVFAVVDWIDLSSELGESPLAADFDWIRENAVNILTVHSSKGLEFPIVFVVSLAAQRFPVRERREQIPIPEELIKEVLPEGDFHLQEERRLFYVAMTRAMDRLYLTAADYYGEGKRGRKISSFVPEVLGEEVLMQKDTLKSQQLSILDFTPIIIETKTELRTQLAQSITYLSYSQIDTFRFCPMHYRLRYILNIPTLPSAPLSFGNTLHFTMRDFYDALKRSEKVGEEDLLVMYEKNWISEGYVNKSHERQMLERGKSYLLRYLKSGLHNPDNLPQSLELPFSFRLAPMLKLGGKMDRIDKTKDGIEIIDYKTTDFSNKELPTEKELLKDLQLSFYALAVSNVNDPIFPKDPKKVTLSLYFFDKGVKVSTTRTVEQLEKAAQEIMEVKEAIEKSDFECSGGFFCQDCEYKLFCGEHSRENKL